MKNKKIFIFSAIILIVLIFLWWTLSPLFLDKRVNETLPAQTDSEPENLPVEFQGTFTDADSFHKTSGTAKIVEIDNKKLLSLEDFETTNGPDLFVYLSKDVEANDFVNLGELKGNIGNQNYEIPDGTNLQDYDKVLIWCKAFSTLFGSAELE